MYSGFFVNIKITNERQLKNWTPCSRQILTCQETGIWCLWPRVEGQGKEDWHYFSIKENLWCIPTLNRCTAHIPLDFHPKTAQQLENNKTAECDAILEQPWHLLDIWVHVIRFVPPYLLE